MNISAEEKNRYLREAEVVLAREGFLTDRIRTGGLRILLDGLPLCEVPESGGVTYRMADVSTPERVAAKDKVYSIVRAVAEYTKTAKRRTGLNPFLLFIAAACGTVDKFRLFVFSSQAGLPLPAVRTLLRQFRCVKQIVAVVTRANQINHLDMFSL